MSVPPSAGRSGHSLLAVVLANTPERPTTTVYAVRFHRALGPGIMLKSVIDESRCVLCPPDYPDAIRKIVCSRVGLRDIGEALSIARE